MRSARSGTGRTSSAVESVKATAWARWRRQRRPQRHDELLSVESRRRAFGRFQGLPVPPLAGVPFHRRQGRKLLFSALGIERHIRQNNNRLVRT